VSEYGAQYLEYQLRKNALRRWVRGFYVRHYVSHCIGATIDFGCGPGQVLEHLPPGSTGLDVNPAAINYCHQRGLVASVYAPEVDQFELRGMDGSGARTLFCAHVIEHLDHPAVALQSFFRAALRLKLARIVLVVPGPKGFASDPTHRSFVDATFFRQQAALVAKDFELGKLAYFPGPWPWIGKVFTYHELMAIYVRRC
jgi:SAM-dependent methyltransferase